MADSKDQIPGHIAIVMDGNGRWATKRLLPRIKGHQQGVSSLKRCIKACVDRGIGVLTVFAFSSENWSRPEEEVGGLMDLLIKALDREIDELDEQGIRLIFPGGRDALAPHVKAALVAAEERTCSNRKITVNVCFNYGGRWDVVEAANRLIAKGEPVTEQSLSRQLALSHVSDPDLLIRTGGEMRISNFLIWQIAYSELFFSAKLWPDFDEKELDAALLAYAKRERRFGKTSEQLAAAH
ncbi:MAG: di-trans,poly-cis-decaprenylcistransferase [Pseudomonadota bacterium]|jgi:undecaprenyl diphosphate synthase